MASLPEFYLYSGQ